MKHSIVVRDDSDIDDVITAITSSECPVVVKVEPFLQNRSLKQNALLWLWMGHIQKQLAEAFGQFADTREWHETLVRRLLPNEVKFLVLPDGYTYFAGRTSTRNMKVKEFADYLNLLEAYAADILDLQLPHPDDLYWEALMKDERH